MQDTYFMLKGSTYFPNTEPLEDVIYIGITYLSIHITLEDGRCFRITNPDFSKGLDIKVLERA